MTSLQGSSHSSKLGIHIYFSILEPWAEVFYYKSEIVQENQAYFCVLFPLSETNRTPWWFACQLHYSNLIFINLLIVTRQTWKIAVWHILRISLVCDVQIIYLIIRYKTYNTRHKVPQIKHNIDIT